MVTGASCGAGMGGERMSRPGGGDFCSRWTVSTRAHCGQLAGITTGHFWPGSAPFPFRRQGFPKGSRPPAATFQVGGGKGNPYQEEVKHNHPSPASIQGLGMGWGLPGPQHGADPWDKPKTELIQLTGNRSKLLNFTFQCSIKPLCTEIFFFSPTL